VVTCISGSVEGGTVVTGTSHEWVERQKSADGEIPPNIKKLPPPAKDPKMRYFATLVEVAVDDPSASAVMEDGTPVTVGVPLRVLVDDLGGYEGSIPHPATGEPVNISLVRWKGRDPEKTLLQLVFHSKRVKK
jgi:hypothetical protein